MLLKSRASPDMLPFSLCNKKRLAIRHTNRPPLFPTTLWIPSYDIGKWVELRTYQHHPCMSLRARFSEESCWMLTCVLILYETCVWNISYSKKHPARYYRKLIPSSCKLAEIICCSCQILMTPELFGKVFLKKKIEKYQNYENPSSGSRVTPWGRTDRQNVDIREDKK